MRFEDLIYLPSRILYSGLWILTSSYCLLAFVPFTYHAVLQAELIQWLPLLAKLHSALFWFGYALVGVTLVPHLRDANRRRSTALFLTANAGLGGLLALTPLLLNLQNAPQSYYLALACLMPPIWLARLDAIRSGSAVAWAPRDPGAGDWRALVACGGAALALWFGQLLTVPGKGLGLATAAAYVLVAATVYLALLVVRGLAGMHGEPARAEWSYLNWLATLVLFGVLRDLVLPNISFTGLLADGYSLLAGYALTRAVSAGGLWAAAVRRQPVDDGIATYFEGALPLLGRYHAVWAVYGLVAAFAALKLPPLLAPLDWNDMLQKLTAAIGAAGVFAACYGVTRGLRGPVVPSWATVLIAVVGIGPFALLRFAPEQLAAADVVASLDEHAATTPAYGLIHERLQPASRGGDAFFRFLELNTNLPAGVQLTPMPIDLAEDLQPAKGALPHVFVFVVDSLRSDYMLPYNDAAGFTPEIDAFAKESLVFRNAFSRFGGTALSEPSIWMGGVSIHKHYVQPFAPLNALEKLLEVDNYEQHITRDTILRQIVKPSGRTRELDRGVPEHELDLCRSLAELEGRLPGLARSSRRMFVYSQSQNIHISKINREGRSVVDAGDYGGFDAPYASRLRRVDGCFGGFVRALKEQGLYEDSVVVLTSDHGDSMGEDGRWGHAFSIHPEVLRVPLLMHLPERYLRNVYFDLEEVAFTTDITPTLYWMLGHGLPEAHPLYGRPLLAPDQEAHDGYLMDWYAVASSYGPVYGVLERTRRTLYIADAKGRSDSFYDLGSSYVGAKMRVTERIRQGNRERLRQYFATLNEFYGYLPAQ